MRHAKSDWSADYDSDHDRPLNDRGIRSARLMGRLLADRGLAPELIVSSTAVRARRTVELAMDSGRWDSALELDERFYFSGLRGAHDAIRRHGGVDRLMLVGHQPIWSLLVSDLTGRSEEMKTASVAVIDQFDAGQSAGVLAEIINPRDYFDSEYDD